MTKRQERRRNGRARAAGVRGAVDPRRQGAADAAAPSVPAAPIEPSATTATKDAAPAKAGRKPPTIAARKPNARFNKATATSFIGELARSCNVTRAARAAKVPVATVYSWRRADSGFRDAWADALVEGYLTLETLVLGSAIDALDDRRRSSKAVERRGSIGDATRLLSLHRQSVRDRLVQAGNDAETRRAGAELDARLAEIRARLAANQDAQPAGVAEPDHG